MYLINEKLILIKLIFICYKIVTVIRLSTALRVSPRNRKSYMPYAGGLERGGRQSSYVAFVVESQNKDGGRWWWQLRPIALGRIGGAVTENGRHRRSCNVEINQGIRNTYGTEADTLIKEFEVNRGSHCLKTES